MKPKHFLSLKDMSDDDIDYILKLATRIKKGKFLFKDLLQGKSLGLLFDKHSTRTRLSFEAGINQLGGNAVYMDSSSLQLSRGETIADTSKVLSRYLDGLIIRTFAHKTVEDFAINSNIPVINGLTDRFHPCQALADIFTLFELGLIKDGLKFCYMGDCNNVANSLIVGFSKIGMDLTIGCPLEYGPKDLIIDIFNQEAEKSGSKIKVTDNPQEAAENADIIYTDVWISMGDEDDQQKIEKLKAFQVNRNILKHASKGVKVMHCLPAHRGQEITSEVLDSENSIVWQQAENRLHAQKALMIYVYSR